ncbi:MAG: flagellar protein export ATPase FliI [Sandaracinobacter sp.]
MEDEGGLVPPANGPANLQIDSPLVQAARILRETPAEIRLGRVSGVRGLTVEIEGLGAHATIGAEVRLLGPGGPISAEVAGISGPVAHCLTFNDPVGIAAGTPVRLGRAFQGLRPSHAWLGRVVDGLGRPIDGKGPLPQGPLLRPVKCAAPAPTSRTRVGANLETGVNALDIFVPLCRGQRIGLFAGSGVGKSVLLSMVARWAAADISVIGLIGERGREVQEFIEDDLGPEGLARSIVVVATSDETALMRRQAAHTTLAIAEYFRDLGEDVLCLMDSVTRFAMAQREIGLSAGEPAATKGYTPSVFAELPRLLERAGPGIAGQGSITGLFTVLVDGDDHNEPIADAVRGILDGHAVMSRSIAERGRYPAIDVLKSVSRTLPGALSPERNALRLAARKALGTYRDMEEIIRLGAYRQGSSAEVDEAIRLAPAMEELLTQGKSDRCSPDTAFATLSALLEPELAAAA